MSIGGGVGGGNRGTSSGGIQATPTLLGTSAGQNQTGQDSQLQSLLQQYMQGQQGQQAMNNMIFGGQGFNPNALQGGQYNPGGAPSGQSGAGGPAPYGSTGDPFGIKPATAGGNGAGAAGAASEAGGGAPGTAAGPAGGGAPGGGGAGAPAGGLFGYETGQQTNPWMKGPGGNAESDVMGSYDWMSSGARNNDENTNYNNTGDMARNALGVDAQGRTGGTIDPNNPNQTLEGQGNQFNQGLMTGDQSQLEKGATGGYQQFAAGPNAQESGLYGKTGAFGSTPGQDLQGAESVYRQETGPNAGYDQATKEAMTREATSAVRSPFESARDRMLRGAAARGNVGSTQGAEIQMANQEAGALGDAASRNQVAQAQEAIRQREAGAQGLQGTQNISNAQQLSAIQSQAGQNAQLAGEKLAGVQGVAGMGAAQRAQQALGAQNQANLATRLAGQKAGALQQQGVLNQQQRNTAATGAAGKENMFQSAAQRQQAATQGLQGLYGAGQQALLGQQAGAANLGTQNVQNTTGFANMNNQGAAGASL